MPRMARLTLGIALDFGSKLRPLRAQLERQSALLDAAEAAGFEMVAAGESSSPGAFHLPNALLVLGTLAQRTRLRLCTGVALAARVLSDNRISGLPVLASDGSIVGVLSVYDLLAKPGATVNEIMSREVTTVGDTAALSLVRAVLISRHLRRVPVVDVESRLVGIISLGDLVRELAYR